MTEVEMSVEAVLTAGRHRRDLGNIKGLAQSIARDGLIHAIVVTPGNRLLAGERRLAAVRSLGWKTIAARIVDTLDDAAAGLRIERDENTERLDMKPSEKVALGLALEELERPRAAERKLQSAHRGGRARHGLAPATCPPEHDAELSGPTREVVAEALGISATSYERAKTVVAAASDETLSEEDRKIAQEAMADMDASGRIAPAYERVKAKIRARTGPPLRTQIDGATRQRRAIGNAEAALSGICHGLQQIEEVHPEITSEEAARWADSLSESRRVITTLISRLKDRTNAQSA